MTSITYQTHFSNFQINQLLKHFFGNLIKIYHSPFTDNNVCKLLKKSQVCQNFFQFFFAESLNFISIVIYSPLYFQTKSHNEPWSFFFSFFHLFPFLIFSPCKSYHLSESYLSECLWQYLEEFFFFFSFSNNNHYHYSLLNSSKVLISFNLSQILSQFLPLFYIWTISFLSLFLPPVITLLFLFSLKFP